MALPLFRQKSQLLLGAFYLFLFFSLFCTAYVNNSQNPWFADTDGLVMHTSMSKPWRWFRTTGMRIYLKVLHTAKPLDDFYRETSIPLYEKYNQWSAIDRMNEIIRSEAPGTGVFKYLKLANVCFLALGLTLLSLALSRSICPGHLPEKQQWLSRSGIAVMVVFCTRFGAMTPMDRIIADTLVTIIVPYVLAFLLLFFQTGKYRWLLAASLAAAYAFLVKPAFAFLPLICGLVCAWRLVKNLLARRLSKARSALLVGLLLSLATLSWPLWISWHAGFFAPSQLSAWNNFAFAFFLTKPGDENLVKDEKAQAMVKKLHELTPIVVQEAKERRVLDVYPPSDLSSLQLYYREEINPVLWFHLPRIWKELDPNHSEIYSSMVEFYKLVSLSAPRIIQAHFDDYLKLVASNFLGAFNQLPPPSYADAVVRESRWQYGNNIKLLPPNRYAEALWISDHYRLTIFIICAALLLGLRQFRTPILLLAITHILHMAFCSIGSCIEDRYVASTEFLMLLAFELALASLALRLFCLAAARLPDCALKSWLDKADAPPDLQTSSQTQLCAASEDGREEGAGSGSA